MAPCKKIRGTTYHDNGQPCQCGRERVTAPHTQLQHSWEPCRFLQQSSDSLESTSNQAVRNLTCFRGRLRASAPQLWQLDRLLDLFNLRIVLIPGPNEREEQRPREKEREKERERTKNWWNFEKEKKMEKNYFQAPTGYPPYPTSYHVTNAWRGHHGYEFYPSPPPDVGTNMYPPDMDIQAFPCPYYTDTKGRYWTN